MQFRFSRLAFASVLLVINQFLIDEVDGEGSGETERIIWGRTAVPTQFPYAVALHYNYQYICTASIISPTTVLTAAHCVYMDGEEQAADLFYAIANVNRSSLSVQIYFAFVKVHPGFNDESFNNDIAILKTTEPISYSDEVGPVCIPRPTTAPMEYKHATAMGWGSISPVRISPVYPEELQYVEQIIVKNRICLFVHADVNEEENICATGLFNGICSGDSGGPLVHLSAYKPPVQMGIASYIHRIFGCGKTLPAVWTRVSNYYDFIMQAADDAAYICTI